MNHSSGQSATTVHAISPIVMRVDEYKDRLASAMQAAGVSVAALARELKVSYQAVKKVLDGLSSSFNTDNNATAARFLGVTSDWLASGALPKHPAADREPQPEYAGTMNNARRITIVGTARLAEGEEGFYEEVSSVPGAGDGHIEIATTDPNAYGLRVRGGSMAPAIRDGWYVLVEPNARPAVGEYVLVKLLSGQKMVKELLYQRQDSIEVLSVNSGQRRTIYMEELDSIQAVAAVVSPSKWKPD